LISDIKELAYRQAGWYKDIGENFNSPNKILKIFFCDIKSLYSRGFW
jgi:hypothetical protein